MTPSCRDITSISISTFHQKLKVFLQRKRITTSSSTMSRVIHHSRSVSLPSRPHPTVPEYDEILCRLKSSESCSSSSSIRSHLDGLHDLHDCLDSLLHLPESQQALAKECDGKWVDQVLDGSLRLLDICGTAKDSLSMTKDCVQEFHSSFRRKGGDAKDAGKYIACRKSVKKSIQKTLKSLKNLQMENKEQDSFFLVSMLKKVEQVCLSVLEAVLSFISGQKEQSLISKLMNPKSNNAETPNEFELIDATMQSIVKDKACSINSSIQGDISDLELCVEDLESGIECLHKDLIKTRVTLLNIISN